MRSKLPRRGENSADCAQAQPSERVHFGAKKQPQKKGKARSVFKIRKSFPAKKQSHGKTVKIREKLSPRKKTQNKKTVETECL